MKKEFRNKTTKIFSLSLILFLLILHIPNTTSIKEENQCETGINPVLERVDPPRYRIIDLGMVSDDLDFLNPEKFVSINNCCQVAGSSLNSSGNIHAFYWDESNGMIDMGVLGTGHKSRAFDINDLGQVTGMSYTGEIIDGYKPVVDTFVWTIDEGMVDITPPTIHDYWFGIISQGESINNGGRVVGTFTPSSWYLGKGLLYYNYYMFWFPENGNCLAHAINNNNKIVGMFNLSAFYGYWSATQMKLVYEQLLPDYMSRGKDINDQDQIAGSYWLDGDERACYWEKIDNEWMFTDLALLSPELNLSRAMSINNHGQIVGRYRLESYRAFLWEQNNGTWTATNLNDAIPADSGWQKLVDAMDINDHGQIVGIGKIQNQYHTFLLTPYINNPPEAPSVPEGENKGWTEVSYNFSVNTTDLDGDDISYNFSWGDGSYSGWTEFVPSGTTACTSYNWSEPGTYSIKVKAKDIYNEESNWSLEHTILISDFPEPNITINRISGGIAQINVEIANIGKGNASNITWDITVRGGVLNLIDVIVSGTIKTLEANDYIVATTDEDIRGLGKIEITVTADENEKKAVGFVLGKFVLVIRSTGGGYDLFMNSI